MRPTKFLKLAATTALTMGLVLPVAGDAFASGGSGGGGGSGSATPACASVVMSPMFIGFFGGGRPRLIATGNVTNCGSSAISYTGVTTDIGTHTDPTCALGSSTYHLASVAPGATYGWFQSTNVLSCMSEYYVIRVDIEANNTVLASATVTFGTPPSP
ncbi:MAG: hypothetical protein RLZZ623_3438 [Actinomycetota bacterium]|jgi:hypothetical protein